MKFKISLLAASVTLSLNSFADSSVGCGLGSMIFKENSLLSSSARVTTNNISLTQYFGVTSGTSGCARHDIVMDEKSHIHFAEINLNSLSIDMAKGNGEYLANFAKTLGCDNESLSHLGEVTQKNFKNIFTSRKTDAGEMMMNLGKALRADNSLNQNCYKAKLI